MPFRTIAAAIALAVLAACGQPAQEAPPAASAGDPMPALPEWANAYIGTNIVQSFPQPAGTDNCLGFADGVAERYGGAAGGTRIVGWGWSTTKGAAYDRILTADANGLINGAGTTDSERADVTGVVPAVTNPRVGYTVYTTASAGAVSMYGVDPEAGTACGIGTIEMP